jgi:hypothetical protein
VTADKFRSSFRNVNESADMVRVTLDMTTYEYAKLCSKIRDADKAFKAMMEAINRMESCNANR